MCRFFHLAGVICLLVVAGCSQPAAEISAPDWTPGETVTDTRPVILFLGDSLTAGYHLDPEEAFPAIVQRLCDANGLSYRVVNAGVSGDTSIAGLNRLDWLLTQPIDVLVLALGANDALRGHPLSHTEENLRGILERTRTRYPDVRLVVAGMRMPVNYGEPYRSDFEEMYDRIAHDFDATLIPFLLEGVAANPDLNLPDGIHPTSEGHRVIAETVWRYLEPVLVRPAK